MANNYIDRFTGSILADLGKAPCDAASSVAINLFGYQTVDGVMLNADNMRCLVMGQNDPTKNGIYVVLSDNWVRAPDFNGPTGTVKGQLVWVTGGTSNAGMWQLTTSNPVQIDQSGGQTTPASNITFEIAPFTLSINGTGGEVTLTSDDGSITITVDGNNIDLSSSSGNATEIQGTPVSATTPTINQTLIFNGTDWVPAAQGTSFAFAVASFGDSNSSPIEIGSGVWKASGNLSFTASYSNGPATAAHVSMSGAGNTWSPNSLTMTSSYQGPTATGQDVDYPSSPDASIVFTLSASGAAGSASATINHTFNNRVYYGTSSKNSSFASGDVTGLASDPLQGTRAGTFTVNASSGNYIVYAYPARYGAATFTVGGFAGGFSLANTVSITNASGYAESYNVYVSDNSGLGSTTVTVS